MTKVAVSRDAEGEVTELSAVCPHLQCVVHWNQSESTWDCPCHGSRFRADGECINGPANRNLAPIKEHPEAPLGLPGYAIKAGFDVKVK